MLPGPYRSQRCQFPFAQVIKPSARRAGFFRVLRCLVIELAGLIRGCLRYHAIFIVFGSVWRHKSSDYSKKASKLMRKYTRKSPTFDVGTSWMALWISPVRQCKPAPGRPGANACTVSTRSGAVCVRGFVFLGMCGLFQIGSALFSVSMQPWGTPVPA